MSERRPLAHQLLASHLIVASIGLVMLFIALISTYGLRSRVVHLADEASPMAQASLQVLAGVRRSIAGLGGWVNLGDEQFLQDWRAAWRDEIEPAMATLKKHSRILWKAGQKARLDELPPLLADLKESQWWVQDVARSPGNEPARVTYLFEAEPIAETLNAVIAGLIQEENHLGGGIERKALLAQFAEVQRAFAVAHLLLREIISEAGLEYEKRFGEQLQLVQTTVAAIVLQQRLLSTEQQRLLQVLRRDLRAFDAFAEKIIAQRSSAKWNVAQYLMATEMVPLASRVTDLAAALAANSAALMEHEAELAGAASAVTVWILVVLIVTMLIVAYGVSWGRAETLARPIATLSEATQQLAAGRLTEDIPVTRNDELGDLTRAFNSMRTSLHQVQEALREVNAFLEERVMERTAELEQANVDLRQQISVRKQAEAALRESEARLRAIASAVPDLLFVLDKDGRYIEVLTSQQHLFNAGAAALNDKLLSEVHPADKAEFFLSIIRLALSSGQIQVAEYELEVSAGKRWFESRTAPVEVPSAAKPAVVVVARDITQRKAAEERLRQTQKMEAIGHLTGGVAHDFNNLLAIVLGNLELLEEQLSGQPELSDLLRRAVEAADRGATLTQRLLAFSRQQPLQARSTNLNELVSGMIDLLQRTLGETIEVRMVLAPDLQQILIDSAQFENALINLVLNARDAMPDGGKLTLETANVWLDESYVAASQDVRPGQYVMISISDTGSGIAPEVLDCVFEPFFTTKEVGKGSGLGLSMVYGLVKQSEGHVAIYSELQQGTTVKIYLPAIRAVTVAEGKTEKTKTVEPLHQGKAEIVLVVEDDVLVRQLAVKMLNSLGYSTLEAGDAKSALSQLDEEPKVVLLFTDVVLPGGMNGAELAHEAQRRHPSLKLLFTSGYTEDALVHQGRLKEGIELLAKPYRKADLASKLHSILDADFDSHITNG